jgi:DNA mismatch endonuclease, patch repair protein
VADNLSAEDRKKTMRAVKGKRTSPERRLRAMLAGMGLRGWRVNYDEGIGKPDVAFAEQKVAIFVDGCFWHGCPVCNRPMPATNVEYWERKIRRNVERDRRYDDELAAAGWLVVRVWGHELKKRADLEPVRERIRQAVGMKRVDRLNSVGSL